jgi:hypothetical protein
MKMAVAAGKLVVPETKPVISMKANLEEKSGFGSTHPRMLQGHRPSTNSRMFHTARAKHSGTRRQ